MMSWMFVSELHKGRDDPLGGDLQGAIAMVIMPGADDHDVKLFDPDDELRTTALHGCRVIAPVANLQVGIPPELSIALIEDIFATAKYIIIIVEIMPADR